MPDRPVSTPFLVYAMNQSLVRKPLHSGPSIECPWCKHTFQAEPKSRAGVAAALAIGTDAISGDDDIKPTSNDLGNCIVCDGLMTEAQTLHSSGGLVGTNSLAAAASSKPGGSLLPAATDVGRLQPIAAKVLMQILYAARLA
eukprot:5724033-Heterocapsa_arctica.AAC.1